MSVNVGDSRLRRAGQILLLGSCIEARYPAIVDDFRSRFGEQAVLEVCLEETHVNQAGFKIASIIRYADIKRVTVLTSDGSPHCVQLHMVVEDIKRHFTPEIKTAHWVIEKDEVYDVSSEAIKRARHLSKIQNMIDSS